MAQHDINGMTIVEAPAADERIDVDARPVAAFLGRAAAGPVDSAVVINSLAHFDRVFGGDWATSALGLTLAQYFQHGGREAAVVRVANNATGGRLELPTERGPLVLVARNPGSRERLRASVDYDGIEDDKAFNLTVQRLDVVTGQIADQEFHTALSAQVESRRFIGRALESSSLVRRDPTAADVARPLAMRTTITNATIGYIEMTAHGDDGTSLTDYDLIGSDRLGTGLFALDAVPEIDLLYACGDAGLSQAGPAFHFAAERYCQSRNALLIVDPPAGGSHPLGRHGAGAEAWRHGPNALTYYPALRNREGETPEPLPAAGALAGVLARQDRRCHVWAALSDDLRQNSAALHRDWLPWTPLETDDALRLLRAGINPLLTGTQRRMLFPGLVTCANASDRERGALARQRLNHFILRRIELGTRWAVFAPRGEATWRQVQDQVVEFLETLAGRGAFETETGWSVRCDAATNADTDADDGPEEGVRLLIAFMPRGAHEPQMYSIVQHRDGTSACRAAFEYPAP